MASASAISTTAEPQPRDPTVSYTHLLNTCTTYLGASVGTAVAGTLYTHAGFESLGLAAATAVALAALALHWRLNGRRAGERRAAA